MKVIEAGYLTRRDDKNKEIFTIRVLIYKEDNFFYAYCLELGILGKGKNQQEALSDLIVLIEDDFMFRSTSKILVQIIPAKDLFFILFNDFCKKHHRPLLSISEKNYNKISKQHSFIFNSAHPKNYEMRQPIL